MLFGATSRTINQVLLDRSVEQPEEIAYRFLSDDGIEYAEITYRDLDESARRIGAWIQSRGLAGQPIPLIFSPGLDFVRAFYGCLCAGSVAVPLSPPSFPEGASRMLAVLADVCPSVVLVADTVSERLRRELSMESERLAFELVPYATLIRTELVWREPHVDPDDLAILQYTSGSTSSPKGVEISHRNLTHNISLISATSCVNSQSIGVSWLPHFHDMGLIGGILMPLYAGFPVTLMSPASFVRRPVRWFEAISRFRATISGGPNFGYEHCLRELTAHELRSIDLSSWRTAYTGAEPIRAETIARFSAAFRRVGFRKGSLFPCYGLAEATLMISGQPWSDRSERRFTRSSLEGGCALEAGLGDDCTTLISSGSVLEGHRVLIVDPVARTACEAGSVGEIWVCGPSVGRGYWRRPSESSEVFRARLPDVDKEFLRTGDLGFLWHDQLFVVGREKDLLIIRGANFYPQDIECALEAAIPTLRAGFGAAFTVEEAREERLVIAYEPDKASKRSPEAEFDAIVAVLAKEFALQAHAIVLVKRNRMPRTTSGKIRRQQCRLDFIGGRLATIAEWRNPANGQQTAPIADHVEFQSADAYDAAEIGTLLKAQIAELLGLKPDAISDSQSIFELGIDSLLAARLQNRIERSLKIKLDMVSLLDAGTIGKIVLTLVDQANKRTRQQSDDFIGDIFERVSRLSDDEVVRLLSLEEDGAVRG
jgi:acyl-CoA synthetase (AMP-forming)/AMP-acid ligase II/acyl carrier protein